MRKIQSSLILTILEVSKMKAIGKVEKNGITIPIDKLKATASASDLVEIEIKKLYADNDVKESLPNFAVVQ
jgi:hypothetical protein